MEILTSVWTYSKKEQLFSYLSWGNGKTCILFDFIYIANVANISYYPNEKGWGYLKLTIYWKLPYFLT